jgi:hypothetical protein
MVDPLRPEDGGSGVENSQVGYTREEAKANWEKCSLDIGQLSPVKDFSTIWEKVEAFVKDLIAKWPR